MIFSILHVIGQTEPKGSLFTEVLPWIAVLIGVLIVATSALLWIKRRCQEDTPGVTEGYTLHDLRRMHEDGALSDDEFAAAKQVMIEQLKRATSENVESPESDHPNNSDD